MTSNAWTGDGNAGGAGSRSESETTRARSLLRYGTIVGPFYLALGIAQGLAREGFDFKRHALSHLANGSGGWIQVANFILSGVMVIAVAVGLSRALRPQSRAAAWFLGAFGAGMLIAAVCKADPVDGFPVGTPLGPPTSVTTTGMIHFAAAGLGFISLAVSCFLVGRAMSRRRESSMARLSLAAGLIVLLGFFAPAALPGTTAGIVAIWASVVAGWAWLAMISTHLSRAARS